MSASSLNSAAGGECAAGSRRREGRDRRPGAGPRSSGRFPPGGSRRPVSGTDTRGPPRRPPCPARGAPRSRGQGGGSGPYRSPGRAAHQVGPRAGSAQAQKLRGADGSGGQQTSPEQPAVTVSAPTRYSTPRQRPSAIPSWHAHLAVPGSCRNPGGLRGLDHTGRSGQAARPPRARDHRRGRIRPRGRRSAAGGGRPRSHPGPGIRPPRGRGVTRLSRISRTRARA